MIAGMSVASYTNDTLTKASIAKNALRHSEQFEPEITMWIFEEDYEGKLLSHVINETHENPRYLPGIQLGENVVAQPDIDQAMKDATALVFVLPHQFLRGVLKQLKGKVNETARGVSLIKARVTFPDIVAPALTIPQGVDVQGHKIQAFATLINEELGISCSSLSGANIANEGMSTPSYKISFLNRVFPHCSGTRKIQ